MQSTLTTIASIAAAYLLGAVPWGLILVRGIYKIDVRTIGSGNIGATNVRRAAGNCAAILVLLLDAAKGAVPVWVVRGFDHHFGFPWQWLAIAVALAAIIGHVYPIYLGFKPSGKGVATALGGYLALSPWAALVALGIFVATAAATRKASVGSLVASISLLPAIWIESRDGVLFAGVALSVILIFWRHRENIERLSKGKEPSLSDRPKG
jgi:glycerol-3-phosphate acyltransferase PlsY